jgi:RHS repeat-associated protein
VFVENYLHDVHGNMTRMPQLQVMQWDLIDQLYMTQRQAVNADDTDGASHQGERTYYVYDSAGQRARKVTERQNGTLLKERIYLGGFEVYREYDGSGTTITLERETLHVMDDKQRVALVETRKQGSDGSPAQLTRYQFGNHLGSACLELDDQAQIISYEEYYPYGSTSYEAVRNQNEIPKRYRYTGMERDEESGLEYHSVRYYAPWLGRWTACDPIGLRVEANLYAYANSNPIRFLDREGEQPADAGVTCYRSAGVDGPCELEIPASPPAPSTPRQEQALRAGEKVGEAYGDFDAGLEHVSRLLNKHGAWDSMSAKSQKEVRDKIVQTYNQLPQPRADLYSQEASEFGIDAPDDSAFYIRGFNEGRASRYASANRWNKIEDFAVDIAPFVAEGLLNALSKLGGARSLSGVKGPSSMRVLSQEELARVGGGGPGYAGLIAKELGGAKPIPVGTNLALSLPETLEAFAKAQDSAVSVFGAWDREYLGAAIGNVKEFKGLFHRISATFIANGGRLKFNLTGIKAGLEGTTTWELQQILKSPELEKSADFFLNGVQLTGAKLEEALKPWR